MTSNPRSRLFPTLARAQQGSALPEFAILLIPFLVIIMGGLDLAHQSYVRSIAQGALYDAARRATVQDPQFNASGATLEERIENSIIQQLTPIAINSVYTITQESFFDFNDMGNPERILTDKNKNGQYDADDDDCFEDFNRNDQFDLDGGLEGVGGANDVVFYAVEVDFPRLLPVHMFTGGPSSHKFTVQTAVRNQPYANQATPPVLCGV